LNYKVLENRRRDSNDGHEFKGEQIVYVATKGEVKNPRSGKAAHPRFLGETRPMAIAPEESPGGPTTNTSNFLRGSGCRAATTPPRSAAERLARNLRSA